MQTLLNKIHCGDSLDYLQKIPDASVDLIISSPPYGIGKEYEKNLPLEDYLQNQKLILSECVRILKENGSIFWQVGSYSSPKKFVPLDLVIYPILTELDMELQNRIIWTKPHGLNASKKFSCRHETILWMSKGANPTFNLDSIRVPQKYGNKKYHKGDKKGKLSCNPLGKNPGDIWSFSNVKHNHEEQTLHPCQFPEGLITRVILACSNENDVVLDPYMGAGTVAVVANQNNRNFLGAEKEAKYVTIANRRISGLPDENNSFPNLKTLREFVENNDCDSTLYSFDRQKEGSKPSLKKKVHSEQQHLHEQKTRLEYEETAFIEGFQSVVGKTPNEHRPPLENTIQLQLKLDDK